MRGGCIRPELQARRMYRARIITRKKDAQGQNYYKQQHEQEEDVWPAGGINASLLPSYYEPRYCRACHGRLQSSNHHRTLIASLHPTPQGTDHADAPAHGACMGAIVVLHRHSPAAKSGERRCYNQYYPRHVNLPGGRKILRVDTSHPFSPLNQYDVGLSCLLTRSACPSSS